MEQQQKFVIGAPASCSDGMCGSVTRVVVDPVAQAVTHLVVEPTHRQGLGRLVPLDLVDVSTGEVRLRCTIRELEDLEHAEETQFLPGSGGHADYPAGQALTQPYFGLKDVIGDVPQSVTYDTVPLHEVEVRRGEPVLATDGTIGSVEGLIVHPRTHGVSHVLLKEGHLWGRKEVAIPIGAVAGADNGIHLKLTKREVKNLPAVQFDHLS